MKEGLEEVFKKVNWKWKGSRVLGKSALGPYAEAYSRMTTKSPYSKLLLSCKTSSGVAERNFLSESAPRDMIDPCHLSQPRLLARSLTAEVPPRRSPCAKEVFENFFGYRQVALRDTAQRTATHLHDIMGKKRKAGGRYGEPKAPKDEDLNITIDTFADVADSEDEFHINRDKVLLEEGPVAKRMRKWREEEQFLEPSDEEVLDYNGLEESDDDDDDDDELEEDGDEEVDDAASEDGHDEDEEEGLGAWGPSKKDYYNADAIETEQDALDEEKEALRIQKKQLAAMTEADFGFDEDEWLADGGDANADAGKVVTEVLPQLQITEDMTEEEKMKILKTRYPEFEFIAGEFLRLQPLHDELAATANAAQRFIDARATKSAKTDSKKLPIPMAITKYQACAAYLAAMSMYFAILASTAKDDGSPAVAMEPAELHEHPVMESLLRCQKLWARVENLPVADPLLELANGDELSVIEEASSAVEKAASPPAPTATAKKPRKSREQRHAEAARAKADARRAEKLRQTEAELASLSALTDKKALKLTKKKSKSADQPKLNLLNAEDSDFGEETEFTAHELAEKAKKKKSLRFYTSQITQKANKRDAAGKDYGGDADIPHRERLKDRQARLQEQAEKKGQNANKGPGVALGEGSDDDEGDVQPRGNDMVDDDGYYDMVAARGNAKKQSKLDRAAAYALAAKEGGMVVEEEIIGDDGRRQVSSCTQYSPL
jgi:U3 small nucleolar RNA-associated protein 3